ncbi:MAG: diadenylate cyclase CdaA [Acutalibacter sp.]|nr:diadenylate cyclase CdaA [Acutalibacter sp.]
MEALYRMGQTVLNLARQFTLLDLLDVLIVTALLYFVIKLVRETRAGQLVKGIILLVVLFLISSWWELTMLNAILRSFFQSAFIVAVILFQPEIRQALEQVGRSKVGQSLASAVGVKDKENESLRHAINGVVEATAILQQMRMGALIVFERATKLGEIAATGTIVEADPSAQLIANIFFNKAPLHDGAMIIRNGRVYAAGCILPLTVNDSVSVDLGTRHRAALGMSENSDAVVVVVSEETGQISIARNGKLTRNYNRVSLGEMLEKTLIGSMGKTSSAGKGILGKLGRGSNSSKKGG